MSLLDPPQPTQTYQRTPSEDSNDSQTRPSQQSVEAHLSLHPSPTVPMEEEDIQTITATTARRRIICGYFSKRSTPSMKRTTNSSTNSQSRPSRGGLQNMNSVRHAWPMNNSPRRSTTFKSNWMLGNGITKQCPRTIWSTSALSAPRMTTTRPSSTGSHSSRRLSNK